jgi:CRP-like cAMP-binding protein
MRRPLVADTEWWVAPLRWVALAAFVAIPIFSLIAEDYAGGIVWTIVVASLPLFIVLIGYHRWRRMCPLAFFTQLPALLGRAGTRRAGPWLETNYAYVAFSTFFVSLWLRLIATNGDGQAIAAFFGPLSLTAILFGFIFTGKTWCNYVCPVSFIEKIYTEPHGLRETRNSQCVKCTACKKSCPDINEENGYWKEIDARPKRFVYFAFPGLVLGFYSYFYLQSGTWQYYFSGAWTRQPGLVSTAFLPGHDAPTGGFFFLHLLPRAGASALTLAVGSLVSFLAFSRIERLIGRWEERRQMATDSRRIRHVTMTIAAFTAFVTFYSFAGAPTLRRVPWLHHLLLILAVGTATLFLVRRVRRTPQAFAEETLAKTVIKHWEWVDLDPPKDLHEAFLVHTIRSREDKKGSARILAVYKNALRETLANGYVTRQEVQLLESLRTQLQIKKADHEQIMSELAEEERDLLSDPVRLLSAEKVLQLETYAYALQRYLERVFTDNGTPDAGVIEGLRGEYHVTQEEHATVLDRCLGGAGALATQLTREVTVIERTSHTIQAFAHESGPACHFLVGLMRRRRARAVQRVSQLLGLTPEDHTNRVVDEDLGSDEHATRAVAVERLCARIPRTTGEQLRSAYRDTVVGEGTLTTRADILRARTLSTNPYVRAIGLHLLGELGAVDGPTLDRLRQDEHDLVREVASALSDPLPHRRLTTIEKIIALGAAPMFSQLRLEELAELAYASVEAGYGPGQVLFAENEHGDEVFMLLKGEVLISQGQGAHERVIRTVGSGELIGEMAALDPAPRSATVRAGAPGVLVLSLDGDAFRGVIHANPSIATGIIRTLARRLRDVERTPDP